MKIFVEVKANSKTGSVERVGGNKYKVRVKAAPVDGMANREVIKVISSHLSIPKSRIQIKSGAASKHKMFEII